MTNIAGSGSISQRHGSADPDLDPHHGSGTLAKGISVFEKMPERAFESTMFL